MLVADLCPISRIKLWVRSTPPFALLHEEGGQPPRRRQLLSCSALLDDVLFPQEVLVGHDLGPGADARDAMVGADDDGGFEEAVDVGEIVG